MLVVSGLRDEYNTFKSTFLTRPPLQFSKLYGLLADHDYMLKKTQSEVTPAQAFTAAATPNRGNTNSPSADQIAALQQLLSHFGLQVQPQTNSPATAFYANRGNTRGGRGNRGQGRGNNNGSANRSQQTGGGNRSQFSWASNQNTVFGTCNRCGIGHIPSECPNRDPSTYKRPPPSPSAYYADHRSQASTSWLPDTGCNHHVASDLTGFEHSEPYNGNDHLHVGNGQVYTQYPPHGSKP